MANPPQLQIRLRYRSHNTEHRALLLVYRVFQAYAQMTEANTDSEALHTTMQSSHHTHTHTHTHTRDATGGVTLAQCTSVLQGVPGGGGGWHRNLDRLPRAVRNGALWCPAPALSRTPAQAYSSLSRTHPPWVRDSAYLSDNIR